MDDDQEICRVCRCESTQDHPLFHPCKCSGSIRFVHQDCLLEWLSHSKKKYCELCEHPFSFTPIYRDDMPERIPLSVLLHQCTHRLSFLLKISLRASLVAVVWLVFLPYLTRWIWRFYFWSGESIIPSRSATLDTEYSKLSVTNATLPVDVASVSDGFNLRSVLADCFEGQIITAFVIVVFVAAYLFREWVVQNTHANPDLGQRDMEEDAVDDVPQNRRQRVAEADQHLAQEHAAIDTLLNAMRAVDVPDEALHGRDMVGNQLPETQRDIARRRREPNYEFYGDESAIANSSRPTDNHLILGDDTSRPMNSEERHEHSANEDWHYNTRSGQSSSWAHSHPEPSSFHESKYASNSHGAGRIDGSSSSRPLDLNVTDNNPHDPGSGSSNNSRGSFSSTWREERSRAESEKASSAKLRWRAPEFSTRLDTENQFTNHLHEETSSESRESSVEAEYHAPIEDEQEHELRHRHQHQHNGDWEALNNRNEPDAAVEEDEAFDLGEDIDGVLEAIGMRGNPWMLIQNSGLMTLMISLCLGVAIWIPYIIGRVVILIRPVGFIQTPISLMRLATDPVVDFVLDKCVPYLWSVGAPMLTPKSALLPKGSRTIVYTLRETVVRRMGQLWQRMGYSNGTMVKSGLDTASSADSGAMNARALVWSREANQIQDRVGTVLTAVVNRWHQFAMGHSGLDRSVCTIVGYIVLICIGSWYLARKSGAAHRASNTSVNEIIRQQGVFLKVFFFIVLELIVFPTICGILLDIVALPLFEDSSVYTRWAFTYNNPYSNGFLHWFIGTGFMFQFAVFVTLCRDIVRRGVMWFIRDPNDPHFHPVQEIIERPIMMLLRKICSSALLYLTLIVVGIGSVTWTVSNLPGIYPLRWTFDAPLSTLALDFLAVQFLLPPLVQFIQPRELSKRILESWWRRTSRYLRLTSFMFDGRHPEEEGTHVRKTWKAWLLRQKAPVPSTVYADVALSESEDSAVIFARDGQLARVPKHDIVPVHVNRRMIVPVDPDTLEAIDETERRNGHPAASESGEEHSTTIVYIPPRFRLRVIIFLLLMWLSGSVLACVMIAAPVLLGRHVLDTYLTPGKNMHDIYAFTVGVYIIVLMSMVINWASRKIDTVHRDGQKVSLLGLVQYMTTKLKLAMKLVYLAITYCFAMPFLLGITIDLYIFMPIRYSKASEALVLHLSEDWSFGIVYMGIFWGIVYVLPNNALQREMSAILGNGISDIDVWRMTRNIIAPVSIGAVCAILVPGILTWGTIRSLAVTDTSIHLLMFRCAYPIVFCSAVAILLCVLSARVVQMWVRSVRDETYLVGKRLHNFDMTMTASKN